MCRQLRSDAVSIGVGGGCEQPADVPRSWQEATRALQVRQRSHPPNGITAYDQLGLYRVLAHGAADDTEQFIREWLGALFDYDATHPSDMVRTLVAYLDCGGNYDATAAALNHPPQHARYRLQIREVSGHDLTDVEHRLNLHVAVRVWSLMGGPPSAAE